MICGIGIDAASIERCSRLDDHAVSRIFHPEEVEQYKSLASAVSGIRGQFLASRFAVKEAYAKAYEWYQKAAANGQTSAYNNMGRLLIEGKGVEQDIEAGLRCYDIAIESGNLESLYNLAILYYEGKGVAKDRKKAKKLMKQAADMGLDNAQYFLKHNKF